MIRTTALALALLSAAFLPATGPDDPPEEEKSTVVVEMVEKSATDYAFEPAEITVEPGQTIRFVQTGRIPHNVEFEDVPSGAEIDGIRMGPFLNAQGESYEIEIDDRFTEGTYEYICTPHVEMGMTGTIVVETASTSQGEDE